MPAQAVDLNVSASVPMPCKFWRGDDGWIGTCDQFSVRVEGATFEDTKRNMELALQTLLERLLSSSERRRVA